MLVHLELIVERGIAARVIARTGLITGVRAVVGTIDDVRVGVCTVVVVTHREYFRITHHAKSRYTDRVAFCNMEIKTAAGKHTAAFVGLCSFLNEVTGDQT